MECLVLEINIIRIHINKLIWTLGGCEDNIEKTPTERERKRDKTKLYFLLHHLNIVINIEIKMC